MGVLADIKEGRAAAADGEVPLARAVEMCMSNEIKVGSSVHTIMTVYLQEEQGNRNQKIWRNESWNQ